MWTRHPPSLRSCRATLFAVVALALPAPAQDYELAGDDSGLHVVRGVDGAYRVVLVRDERLLLASPPEGLWSIATAWEDGWPTGWLHAQPQRVEREGPWLLVEGELEIGDGRFALRDAYRAEGEIVRCVRRFRWSGPEAISPCTLSVRWQVPSAGARVLLPGICYHGNPSGARVGFGEVVRFEGRDGEVVSCEEHRYPMPFASLEWEVGGRALVAALHTSPSPVPFGHVSDQWWSLGVAGHQQSTELTLLSGPCAANGQRSVVKAQQRAFVAYPDTWLDIPPQAVIEKVFFLQGAEATRRGSGFRIPLRTALRHHAPYGVGTFPTIEEIVRQKLRFAGARWHQGPDSAGFRMYPDRDTYVMGWAGQAAAPGYALLVLGDALGVPDATRMAQLALDHLAGAPLGEGGFPVRYEPAEDRWHGIDPISQGQAMENFARAIRVGRGRADVDTVRWEAFLRDACDFHARRILADDWRPVSTAEGFLVSPLCQAFALFGVEDHRRAARKAAEHYAARHLDMTEPYWGGTLDARCEDKEGAWAAFQAFLAVYELTGEARFLGWAEHALDVVLSYTMLWDVDLPPGRLRDHGFRSRGWTVVSAQNQHLDVFGVLYTPEIHRMGTLLGRPELHELAMLMFRSCGQLIDPRGSQGEQIQHTNFAQQGDTADVYRLRGGYSEGWTVFWITAHFLNAGARLREMGLWR